jgi:ribosomal protein S18 acetylase RimI-like enzyme
MPNIRPLRTKDRDSLYEICLKTGDSGRDATALYRDPELLGHLYAGSYAALEPESCFVLEDEEGVGGYIIGACDTGALEIRQESEWWPTLRERYADLVTLSEAERRLAMSIHNRWRTPQRITAGYPSHLHIDLLPRFQGKGWGKRMMDHWLDAMRARGSIGAHLGVGVRNERAVRFYLAYGFNEIARWQDALVLAIALGPKVRSSRRRRRQSPVLS